MLASLLTALVLSPQEPLEFARQRVRETFGERAAAITLRVAGGGAPESFHVRCRDGRAEVTGADPAGAMYGALELCERGLDAAEVQAAPFLRDRGWNVFVTLPWDYARSCTDYDTAALVDPARWWFQDESYWTTLFDLMAESRLNWLDLHGMWDVDVTDAPNLYAYFVASDRFPAVGPPASVQQKCLERLNWIVARAHARGIRVSLMSYEAKFRTPHRKDSPYEATDQNLGLYTREVVAKLIRAVPGLDAIGFRIGESGRGEAFFQCYLDAVADSGRDIPLYTRSWLARKQRIVPLARAASDFTVELKYNGEQWGPPYLVAGGRMANWYSYSFEDYLSDSGPGEAKQLWPGNPTPDGARWPDQPYKIVWQVRANGTHRVFSFYEPEWIRRSVQAMRIGTASGFSVEALNAFYPAETRYLVARDEDRGCRWIHERDRLFLLLWGRLGYDPATPDPVFERQFTTRFGAAGSGIARVWQQASQVVPRAFTAFSLGPDHRNHAPELELGGDSAAFHAGEAFDSHVFASMKEAVAYRATGGKDGRRLPVEAFATTPALGTLPTLAGLDPALQATIAQLASLRDYYVARFTGDLARARAAWEQLAGSAAAAFYRPFTEKLRLRTPTFHWRNELPKLAGEKPVDLPWLPARPRPAATTELRWREEGGRIVGTVAAAGLARAWLLHKPLPSSTFFHKLAMAKAGAHFVASIPRENAGHLLAAELETEAGELLRIPDWERTAPYLTVPARPGATPPHYASGEALTYLQPAVLTPEKHGLLLLCPRAWDFHRRFDLRTQRKLLDAVERGMTLLVLQQDYTSGRYPLAWLPSPPQVENCRERVFDPAGALGLQRVEADAILWQRFVASPGWEIAGNGGVARREHGKGAIWLVQARFMQLMHLPDCARAMLQLLRLAGGKPIVIVDAGTEGAHFATSVWPDFMNAHDVPFLTLGEVIASEQGVDSTQAVQGRIREDALLEGKGPELMKAHYERRVREAAHRPVPASPEAFATWQSTARVQLLRALGLDPLPERTPLHARITGTIQREGYRIEKLVYESRPRFYVTAHLYIPDGLQGKAPVIVNPHGHWRHKKQEPVVQTRAIAQALQGFVALVVDSPGHSFEGDAPIERREQGPHGDWELLLGGTNVTGVYVWDLMRGLDYLATRPECDLTRVGITGASGGGLATVYAFAADPRFTCAVPVVYATSMEVNPHNGCLCNHVPGTLQIGDRADVLAIRAPAPVLVIGAQDDAEFPPAGTELTGRKLQALWRVLGAEDRVAAQVFAGPHDYNRPMRELAVGFFARWLAAKGDGSPVPEPKCEPLPPADPRLFVLERWPADGVTMRALGHGTPLPAPPPPPLPVAKLTVLQESAGKQLVTIAGAGGLPIPGVVHLPPGPIRKRIVLADARGKAAIDVAAHLAAGTAVLCIDARGQGELAGIDRRLLVYLGTTLEREQELDLEQARRAFTQ